MEQKSILENTTEHDVVEVKSPFDDKFTVLVARSVVAPTPRQHNQPTGHQAADAFLQGIQSGISKGGHTSMAHVQQQIVFEPHQSMRLPGDVARVAVNQMVRKYMQDQARYEKKSKGEKTHAMMMADPHAYMEVEKMIVINSESMLTNMSTESVEERLQRQLDELNQKDVAVDAVQEETAFPTESGKKPGVPAKRTA